MKFLNITIITHDDQILLQLFLKLAAIHDKGFPLNFVKPAARTPTVFASHHHDAPTIIPIEALTVEFVASKIIIKSCYHLYMSLIYFLFFLFSSIINKYNNYLIIAKWLRILVLKSSFHEICDRFNAPLTHPEVRMLTYFQQVIGQWPPQHFHPGQIDEASFEKFCDGK